MKNNNGKNNTNQTGENYSESHGTGVISSMIFVLLAFVFMFVVSRYMG